MHVLNVYICNLRLHSNKEECYLNVLMMSRYTYKSSSSNNNNTTLFRYSTLLEVRVSFQLMTNPELTPSKELFGWQGQIDNKCTRRTSSNQHLLGWIFFWVGYRCNQLKLSLVFRYTLGLFEPELAQTNCNPWIQQQLISR